MSDLKGFYEGYDNDNTGSFETLKDIKSSAETREAFENQVTAIMERKGLLAEDAEKYVLEAYDAGSTLDALKTTAAVGAEETAEARGDLWGSGGGQDFLAAEALKTDQQAYGTSKENAQNLINNLYTEGFGREADASGLAYWSNKLTSGAMSYAKIAESFGQSEEATIRTDYHKEFGRDVDDVGLQYWLRDDTIYSKAALTGSTEQQIRDEYASNLGEFSRADDRYTGGVTLSDGTTADWFTDAEESGYKNLNWSKYSVKKEDTHTRGIEQLAGDTFKYDFGSDDANADWERGNRESDGTYMYGTQYDDDWTTGIDEGTGLSKKDADGNLIKTGVERFRASIAGEQDATSSYSGNVISSIDDVRKILGRREDILNVTSTYDKDDAGEDGVPTGIGRMFTLKEMEPYMSSAVDLKDLAANLGSTKWALLTKELDKTFKTLDEANLTGRTLYNPGMDPNQMRTNRNTLSNKYAVPVPPDFQSNARADVTRQDIDYMPEPDASMPKSPDLTQLDTSKADEQWLNQTYKNYLDRDVGQEGRDYWLGNLNAGLETRDSIRSNIGRGDETWLNKTYKELLGRNLGEEGRDYWTQQMKKGQSKDQIRSNIMEGTEYKDRINQRNWLAGQSAQGVRRNQSEAARTGSSALGTKQLTRKKMQIKPTGLNVS